MREVIGSLQRLDDAGIEYCVLRNFQFATGGELNGDVDVLVRGNDRESIDELLRKEGYYPFEGDTTRQTRYKGYVPEHRKIVTIDLYWDAPTYNGVPFLDGDRVLKNKRRYEGIWIPSQDDYFVELVFHPVLNKNRFRDHYRSELDRLRDDVDPASVRSHARNQFGSIGETSVELALDGRFESIVQYKWKLVQAGVRKNPSSLPILVYNLFVLRELIRPTREFLHRLLPIPKPVIALLGPDGVGKSTIVDGIASTLEQNGYDVQIQKLGIHSGASPLLRGVRAMYNKLAGTNTEARKAAKEEGTDTLGAQSSTVKSIVPLIDWWIRYLLAQFYHGDVLVADRYLHEFPVYFRSKVLARTVRWAEPRDFTGVVLTDEPETIASRSEFGHESIAEFEQRLSDVNLPRVSAADGPEETTDKVLELVFEELLASTSRGG